MNLTACLRAANWRTLKAIALTQPLRLESPPSKAHLVDALARRLGNRVPSEEFRAALTPTEQALLTSLAAAGGSLPLANVVTYGPLRPLTGTGADDPRRLARQPVSPIENLVYRGLVFVVPDPDGAAARVTVPDEWLPLFRPPGPLPLAAPGDPLAPPWTDIAFALAVYLAALQSSPARLSHGRHLGGPAVRHLAGLLRLDFDGRASERQVPPLAFLRYLAERLSLLMNQAGRLGLSPAAAPWLDQPRADRLAALWQVFLAETEDNQALWRQYRLPGHALQRPCLFTARLVARLTDLARHAPDWLHLDDLATLADGDVWLSDLLPWWEREDGLAVTRDTAWALLKGPLCWLGAVEVTTTPAPAWRLTPIGRWLVGQAPPLLEPPTLPLALDTADRASADAPYRLRLPAAPPLATLLAVADWADPVPTSPDDPVPLHFVLGPRSVRRAIARGGRVDDLLHLVTQVAQPPLADLTALEQAIRSWAAQRPSFTVRPLWTLTAADSAHLDRLLTHRGVRRCVVRRLSPAEVELDPASLGRALAVVRRHVGPVKLGAVSPPLAGEAESGSAVEGGRAAEADAEPTRPPSDLAWLLTALHAYTHVAHRLHLPLPPAAIADRLAQQADASTRHVASQGAELAARCLDRALADLDPTLAPLPVEILLPWLEDAVHRATPFTLTYWTPSQPLPTARLVTPHRIEWRGDRPYLIAFCHRQQAERTFRLDRVIEVGPATQS